MTWWPSSSPQPTSAPPPAPPPPEPSYYSNYGDSSYVEALNASTLYPLFAHERFAGGIGGVTTDSNRSISSTSREDDQSMECRELYFLKAEDPLPPVHYLYLYAGSAIVVIGCLGHAVTASALLLSRPLRRQSLAPYLLVLSVAGVLALLAGLAPHVVWHGTCGRINLGEQYAHSDIFCRTLMAARYYALHLYSWTEALIAAERMVAVRWPLQCKRWLTRRAGTCIVAATACILLPIEAVPFVSYGYDEDYFCTVVKDQLYSVWPLTHMAVYCLAPVAVMLPSNALTLSAMRRSDFDSASLRRAKPVTVMMMALNCLFLITATPFVVAQFVRRDDREAFALAFSMIDVCRLLLYAGSASTVFVYVIMAARFRKTLANFATRNFDRLCSALSLPSMRLEAAMDAGSRQRTGRKTRSHSCPENVVISARLRTHSQLEERNLWTQNSVA